jgi:hypothetical protein
MASASKRLAFVVAVGLILPGIVLAGDTPQGFLFGPQLRGQGMVAPACPGVPEDWYEAFVGQDLGGTINTGDHVIGTISATGIVFVTCKVNLPSGTCQVAPGGASISFDLPSVQYTGNPGDISGTAEIPVGAPYSGTYSATMTLTSPHSFQGSLTDQEYACNDIPTVGKPGIVIMALLLAGLGVILLLRRWQA